jgi:pyruvate,orthophosphate dikinase
LPARVARDSYRRLIQMFGKTVPGIDSEQFEHALDSAKQARGAVTRVGSDTR